MTHYYFDQDGNPIDLLEWGRRFEDIEGRILLKHHLDGDRTLITTWLGYVDPAIEGARLFGTALISGSHIDELETYACKVEAADGHARHLEALTLEQR